MKKKIPPKEKHYWNAIDTQIIESAANTLTEVQLATGVSASLKHAMEVKKIILSIDTFNMSATLAPGASNGLIIALSTQQELTAIPGLQDAGTIYYHAPILSASGDGATAAETPASTGLAFYGFPPYVEFDDPLPIVDDTISLYISGVGLNGAITAAIKIYYAVAKVSLEEALTILESYR